MGGSLGEERIGFFDIVYSVAGQAAEGVYKQFLGIKKELLDDREAEVLDFMLKAFEEDGKFPSYAFMKEQFKLDANLLCQNNADIRQGLDKLMSDRSLMINNKNISQILSSVGNPKELHNQLQDFIDKQRGTFGMKVPEYRSVKESIELMESLGGGVKTGVKELEDLTGGFQPGTVATVAAYVAHGKSSFINNLAYVNAMEGRKGVLISLEMAKEVVHKILLARHSFDSKKPIPYKLILQSKKLTKEEKAFVYDELEPDYVKKVLPNLMVLGTEDMPGYSKNLVMNLLAEVEEKLGGLDFVIWDHANIFMYIEPENNLTGNHYIRMLTEVTTSYVNKKGAKLATIMCAQTNRGGWTKASRNDGEYELTALSDFNEIERSSTYVIFVYSDELDREAGNMKVQLKKHRLGETMVGVETIEAQYGYSKIGSDFNDTLDAVSPERMDNAFDTLSDGSSMLDGDLDLNFNL